MRDTFMDPNSNLPADTFLEGGGEMGALTRNYDWGKTVLGTPDTWPQSLRTTVSILLNSRFPMFLFWGTELICFYNDAYRPSLGNNGKHPAVGLRGGDLWQEIWKDIKPLIDQVLAGGEASWSEDQLLPIYRNGKLEDVYWTFSYSPVKDESGKPAGVFVTCTETTGQVKAKIALTESYDQQAALNEELTAANEELKASNEELNESQQNLIKLNEHLADSDNRFRSVVSQAPVGICIIRANDLLIQNVNDAYLELVGKTREELENHTIWDAIPEAAEIYAPVMNEVIETGMPFIAKEHELLFIRNDVSKKIFVNFVYEPIRITDGSVNAIMVLGIDVTDQVMARRRIEEMEERARLAIEAAEIGTFDLNIVDGVMLTSERFNNIFGFDHHVSWNQFASAIHPDDQEPRLAAHQKALETGNMFYEARVIYPDDSIHWVRVQGKVYYKGDREPVRILGTLLDITEFKRLQQQKDDFISIASHELKTPITSLKASLQLLARMKDDPVPQVFARLIDQSNKSVQRVSSLVEDLLNVSRANESQVKLNKTTFNVTEMLNGCCNHIRLLGKHTLTVQGNHDLSVHADEHAIDQVIVNLVNNAVKYAPDSKEIFLIVEKDNLTARISVKDNGPGIPAEKLPHLFDRYYQADMLGYQNSGLGLGLYISAEIIKRHHGQIGVMSELGRGCTFWFTLPLS